MKKFDKQICLFGSIVWLIFIIISIIGWANGDTPSWMLVILPSFCCVLFHIDDFIKIK